MRDSRSNPVGKGELGEELSHALLRNLSALETATDRRHDDMGYRGRIASLLAKHHSDRRALRISPAHPWATTDISHIVFAPMRFVVLLLSVAFVTASIWADGLRPIGSERQFFFDDQIVERLENTHLKLNPAVKHPANPIIKKDKPWETDDMRISWIFYDHTLERFRMRYMNRVYGTDGRDEKGKIIVRGEHDEVIICEAFSKDGVNWVKPELGLVEFEGSKANNIIPGHMHVHSHVFEDLGDPDPERRYKGMLRHVRKDDDGQTFGMTYHYVYSRDGYDWKEYEGNPVIDNGDLPGRWGPTVFSWDPNRKVYVAFMENNFHMHSPHYRRSIGRAESKDMIHWSEPETILTPDAADHSDVEFYWLFTTPYGKWDLGFLWIFSTTNTTHHPEFVFSRDGLNYHRDFREPIIARGDNGDFDSVSLYAMRPIVHNDEVLCYYFGTNWRSPEQLEQLGDKATAGIGLARLPLDGFVSLDGARRDVSMVLTRAFTFKGDALYLNLQAALQQWGAEPCEVRVELLDARHIPIEGHTYADTDVISTSGRAQKVSWNGNSDVSALEGNPIRLKIHFKNAKLYSFQFR